MKQNKSISISTIILSVFGIIALLLIVLCISSFYRLKNISDKLSLYTTTMEDNLKRNNELKEIERAEEELKMSHEILKKKIPLQSSEYQIIDSMNMYAKENNINLTNIQFGDYVENGDLNQMPLNLSFEGKYSDFIKLLTTIENGERLIRIDGISLTKNEASDQKIRADIGAFAFYKKSVK